MGNTCCYYTNANSRVNHHLPILHMSKRMVHIYTTDKTINQFEFGYMINPSLKFNNALITQVEK